MFGGRYVDIILFRIVSSYNIRTYFVDVDVKSLGVIQDILQRHSRDSFLGV